MIKTTSRDCKNELERVNPLLAKLVDGYNLTSDEAEKLVYTIFVYDITAHHFATFIGAIHAKGETSDELLGLLNATKRLTAEFDLGIDANKMTDL